MSTLTVAPIQPLKPPVFDAPVTPYSLTVTLAYIHYYTPKRLSQGHFIAPKHLRILADWIGQSAPRLRSIRQHTALAAHMTLLHAAGLLDLSGDHLSVHPAVNHWLHASPTEQIDQLLTALRSSRWTDTLVQMDWQTTIPIDYEAYLQQTAAQQSHYSASVVSEPAIWQEAAETATWQLILPASLPLWLHFDLRQLGHWSPEQPLTCTPLTIATAAQRGYGASAIQWMLEKATGQPLPQRRQKQLNQWVARSQTYQLQSVRLLSVARPEQLSQIIRRKRLRASIHKQISPRHAIVAADMTVKLEKWLAAQGYPLGHTQPPTDNSHLKNPASQQWLSARILVGLGQIIPLPFPTPHSLLETSASELTELEQAELEELAQITLQKIHDAIRGRDAFFPAQQPVSEARLNLIRQAVNNETKLAICYQALGEMEPTWRELYPLRLEQHGALYYLYAYCLRAEANRTFRLDRIAELEIRK